MNDNDTKIIQIKSGDDFQSAFNVSRETIEKLERYISLLQLWQKKINLISGQTIHDVWQRHIADSAQLYFMAQEHYDGLAQQDACYDFGSGAGFPALVMAILADDKESESAIARPLFSMIENSAKKCAFMREVIRATKAPAEVINKRIETLEQISNSVNTKLITARALAPLTQLFEFSAPVWHSSTKAYFLKGNSFSSEIIEAEKHWDFKCNKIPSLTNQESVILEISALCRK